MLDPFVYTLIGIPVVPPWEALVLDSSDLWVISVGLDGAVLLKVFTWTQQDNHDVIGTHLTGGWRACDSNFVEIFVAGMCRMVSQAGPNFAHATTAELSWHVQNCDLLGSLE